jgi:hypothetical protein
MPFLCCVILADRVARSVKIRAGPEKSESVRDSGDVPLSVEILEAVVAH